MSQMQPQQAGPDMAALLAQLGGQQQEPAQDETSGNWLVEAINAVHSGMSEENDPNVVHQANKALTILTALQAQMSKENRPTG